MMNQSVSPESTGRVIPFRSRAQLMGVVRRSTRQQQRSAGPAPISDLAEFESDRDVEDYRHRMIVNALALVFTVVLIVAGLWLADAIARLQKNEDCVLTGRVGCAPIDVPVNPR